MYDFLIIATGIQYNYFCYDDWQRFAISLASLEDTDAIRRKVLHRQCKAILTWLAIH
jgi:NADH dehydrogenase FAD-containing subunit